MEGKAVGKLPNRDALTVGVAVAFFVMAYTLYRRWRDKQIFSEVMRDVWQDAANWSKAENKDA